MISDSEFANRLYYEYEDYFETSLLKRRFKHKDIIPLINKLKNKNIFTVKKIGSSTEGRDLNFISCGKGKTKVFLWSQMHGNEPTATMAMFDIFNFLLSTKNFVEIKNKILKYLKIYFLPMVNPDGAEKYQRRNIFDIDLNRDAIKLESKEAQILMRTFKNLKADFGFNLHDQDIHYSAGKTFKPATISFLAPPTNEKRENTDVRKDAERLIVRLYKILNEFIPGHIAKYPDEFEPRAFGDNFQKMRTSTILIESGGWKNDPEKQFIRKLNFIALLTAFKSIAENSYKKEVLNNYDEIPLNSECLRDIILRNLEIRKNGKKCSVDIAVNLEEINTNNYLDFYYKSKIEDIGDLSTFYGYEDHDFSGMTVEPGKTFPDKFNSIKELEEINPETLYKKGYTNILLKKPNKKIDKIRRPFNIVLNNSGIDENQILLENLANLVFKKNGKIEYIMINGFLHSLKYSSGEINEGLIVY